MRKVLHTAETALGGVGTYIDFLCEATPAVENRLVIPNGHTALIDSSRTISTFKYRKRGLRAIISHTRALLRAHDEYRPDIVFFHSTFALFPLLFLSIMRPKTKRIYCAHGWAVSQYEVKSALLGRVVASIEGTLSGRADRTVNISHFDRRIAESRRYKGNHITIENAVPEASHEKAVSEDIDPEKINLLFVGRHDKQKGLDVLLQAFRAASLKRQDLALYVIGAPVRTGGDSLDYPDNVYQVGWTEPAKIDGWYRAMDAIVVPSRWEGFGLVVPEAFRNGTPALVSDRGALPDLVDEDLTGSVFKFGVESLYKTLSNVSKSDLTSYKDACRRAFIERFSQGRFSQDIKRLYDEVAS